MMMRRNCLLIVHMIICVSSAALAGAGEDWPQFRGPTQEGKSDSTGLPIHWSTTQNIKWTTPIKGEGWSSPVILDGQIWMTTALEDGRSLHAVCVDQQSGRILHDVEVFHLAKPAGKNDFNSYASPTPVIEPGRVYVTFGTNGSACLDTATGQPIWKNNQLVIDHKEGPGSSPILYNDLFILDCDGTDLDYIAALDKKTGQIRWKTNRSYDLAKLRWDLRKAYCMPTVVNIGGKDLLIDVGAYRLYGYNPLAGRELWHIDLPGFSNAPRPVYRDGVAYVCTGFMKAELWAIRIPTSITDATPTVLWKWKQGAPLKPSPSVIGDLIYFVSDNGIARCLETASGKEVWQGRILGNCSASPIEADGHLYFFDEHGRCAILKAGRKLEVIAENQLPGRILVTPAVSGKAMFIRTDEALYRVEQ
jgi:outer membrane protein assembly factor BamB